ncbi:Zranb3 [Symbiodinium sp. CCMP2456]|nr:Zranb3 [Symbiodinium sp. CCMP2456]
MDEDLLFDAMPTILAYLWAIAAGVSVAFQVGGGIILNDTPSPAFAHASYVFSINLGIGAVWLLALVRLQGGPAPNAPTRKWSVLGGFAIIPVFVCTPAAAFLGTQMILMLVLVGMMTCAIIFDCRGKRLRMTRYNSMGLCFLAAAVGIEMADSISQVTGSASEIAFYSACTLIAGVCYSVQAKMNKRLARDLGSSARSALFCNLTSMLWAIPLCITLQTRGIPLNFQESKWWIWLLCGLQSAFYTYSLAELPKLIGYSVLFVLVLAGKLTTASLADTFGLFSPPRPVSVARFVSVGITVLGAVLFSYNPVGLPEVVVKPLRPPPPRGLPDAKCRNPEGSDCSESGEDSDDAPFSEDKERQQSDMEVLLAHRSSLMRNTSRQSRFSEEDIPASAHQLAREARAEEDERTVVKPSRLSLFHRVFRHSRAECKEGGGRQSMLHQLHQDASRPDDAWFRRWSSLLSKEGLACTKVATNGKPYPRRLLVDCRNLMVEIHGGRSGTVGILLDDLVDVCKACRIAWRTMAVDAQLRTLKAQNSFDFGNKMPGMRKNWLVETCAQTAQITKCPALVSFVFLTWISRILLHFFGYGGYGSLSVAVKARTDTTGQLVPIPAYNCGRFAAMALRVNGDGETPVPPKPLQTFTFGKHRGRSFQDVANTDASYCNWALTMENPNGQLKEFQQYLQRFQKRVPKAPSAPPTASAPRAVATPQKGQLASDITLVCELIQEDQFLVRAERLGSKDPVFVPPHVWQAVGRQEGASLGVDRRSWHFPLHKYKAVVTGLEELGQVEHIPSWVLNLLQKARRAAGDKVQEARLPPKLLPYQLEGVHFGTEKAGRVLIADEMGLGKTLQALALAAQYRENWPVLVVCPSSLRWVWQEQALQWLNGVLRPCDVQVIRKGSEPLNPECHMWIISYNLLASDANRGKFTQRPDGTPHGIVIADESHNMKDWGAARTKTMVPLLRQAHRAVLLSGTPTRNSADELHPQLCGLIPDVARLVDFRARYCVMQQQSFHGGRAISRVVGARCAAELNFLLMSTVMIRRQKKEVLSQLPEKRRQRVPLDVDGKLLRGVQSDDLHDFIGDGPSKPDSSDIFMQIAKAKLKAVKEYLSEVLERVDDKIIIFAHHKLMLDEISELLKKHLPKMSCSFIRIDGSTPMAKRQEIVRQFQEDPSCRIALLSITACGEGLTMTAASLVIFAELYWVPGCVEQAEARAHRIGSTHSKVVVEFLVAPNTPDEIIYNSLERKKQDTSAVLDGFAESMNVAPASLVPKRSVEESPEAQKRRKTSGPEAVDRSKVDVLLKAMRDGQKALSLQALVLHTPARSFSFLFANVSQRDVFGQFLVYLISKHDRGMTSVDTMSAATTARDADLDEPATQANTSPPKEGRGRVTYPNHSWYEGDFSEYQRHGRGTLHLPDGTKHECQWHKDERHGPGREYWADGTVFRGNYVHGLRHGHGVMTWPEGSRYTGLFERGRANGDGELVRTDGSVYRGQFREDCMSGDGCMQWVDGVEYKGQFEANRRHGFGKMVWTSGKWKSYEGSWKAGGQHGRGILTDQDDAVYVGHFFDGKIDHWEGSPPDSGL